MSRCDDQIDDGLMGRPTRPESVLHHVGESVLDSESALAWTGMHVLASSAGRERVSGGRVDLRMCGSVQRGMNVRETIPGSSAPARMELHVCGRVLDSGRVVAQR